MCELFGASSRLPMRVDTTLAHLIRRGGLEGPNRDGWGVALYEGPDAFLLREPRAASGSRLVRYLEEAAPPSRLILAHIRRATCGQPALRNTQPFTRELGGIIQVFAHNGHLPEIAFAPRRFRPVGDTDSEIAFCALLDRLQRLWMGATIPPPFEARLQRVRTFARALRALGPANFLYADGEVLFAHAHRRIQPDERIAPPGLYLLQRRCREPPATAPDPAGVPGSPQEQDVILFASVPLTEEPWQPLPEGEVIAVARGQILARDSTA